MSRRVTVNDLVACCETLRLLARCYILEAMGERILSKSICSRFQPATIVAETANGPLRTNDPAALCRTSQ
jgi:hypothetical protein